MPFGPTLMSRYRNVLNRLLLSDTEQFLTVPIPCLQRVQPEGANAVGSKPYANLGLQLYFEIDRNAAEDGIFERLTLARPALGAKDALPASPWTIDSAGKWILDGSKATHRPGDATNLIHVPATTLVVGATYNTTFTVSGITSGTVRLSLGGTLGTARSTNGTFTESIVCGAGTALEIDNSADFNGSVDSLTVYPNTAPADLDVRLYTCRYAMDRYRSTMPFETIVFPSATQTICRLTKWVPYEDACDGLQIGLDLAAAYTLGQLFGSIWVSDWMWGGGL